MSFTGQKNIKVMYLRALALPAQSSGGFAEPSTQFQAAGATSSRGNSHPLRLYRVEIAKMGCGQSRFGGRHCAIRLFGTKLKSMSSSFRQQRRLSYLSLQVCPASSDQFFAQQNACRIKSWMQKWAASVGKEHQDTGNAPQHMAKSQAAEIY